MIAVNSYVLICKGCASEYPVGFPLWAGAVWSGVLVGVIVMVCTVGALFTLIPSEFGRAVAVIPIMMATGLAYACILAKVISRSLHKKHITHAT